jgi:uncharacterized protein YjbI with pentapeptide repeats
MRARYWPRVKETSLDAWRRSAQAREWTSKHPNLAIAPAVSVAILFLLIAGQLAVAATLIGAWFALARGISQAAADFRRRINETYSKAVSQLASDKLEERLGGIYTLENISKESRDDYWTVMETLTAFVRERSQRNYNEFKKSDERISPLAHALWKQKDEPGGKQDEIWAEAIQLGEPLATDIAAVLTVIKRRNEQSRELESTNGWRFDLSQAVLKRAHFRDAHLEGADLRDAHLEGTDLRDAHLEGATLVRAHLEGADLRGAHLEGADLMGAHLKNAYLDRAHLEGANLMHADLEKARLRWAHLERADLIHTHLEGAILMHAHLEGASLMGAYLEGADLRSAEKLPEDRLTETRGDAATHLPDGVARPAHWPAEEDAEPAQSGIPGILEQPKIALAGNTAQRRLW